MQPTAATRIVAVIGDPVAHSLSPAIHNAAFAQLGIDCMMVGFQVPRGHGERALDAMFTLDLVGFAVTTPLKAEMAALVDTSDDASNSLNSVNTIIARSGGSVDGASTDGDGFVAAVSAAGDHVEGRRVVIIGAGAAARSVVYSLGTAGAAHITVVNRTRSNAETAASLAPQAEVGTMDAVEGADLVVNTTSVGMGDPSATPLDQTGLIRPDLVVADIVYHPLETRLLRDAKAAGAETIDGLGMLVEQARLQQMKWFGVSGDPGVMRSAAQAQLARR